MKNLMIVESPKKVATVTKYLKNIVKKYPEYANQTFQVIATVGHFNKLKDVGLYQCGYDPKTKDIAYQVSKPKVYQQLKNLPHYDKIYIATDIDNEGEGIAFQARMVIPKKAYGAIERIGFDEITENAIYKAMQKPIGFDINKYNAYKYRAIGDKLIGYYGSRKLINDLGHSYSTGRIQADVVLISGAWEKEIKDYKPDYRDRIKVNAFNSSGFLKTPEGSIYETKEPYSGTFKVDSLSISTEVVSSKEDVKPFVMSDILSKFASSMSSSSIANHLQSIKDKGYITYHRTDNPKMDDEFYNANKTLAKNYLANLDLKANDFKYQTGSDDEKWVANMKKKGRELHLAHSGIRTTDLLKPTNALDLSKEEKVIYDYIREQTISFFCSPNKWENLSLRLKDAKGYYVDLPFRNYLEINVYKDRNKKVDIGKWNKLKELKPEDRIAYFLENVMVDVNTPPKKMNDTNMLKKLEDLGVGTPATIHSFIPITRTKEFIGKIDVKLTPKGQAIYSEFLKDPQSYFFADTTYTRDIFEKVIHKLEKNEIDFNVAMESLINSVNTKYEKLTKDEQIYKKVNLDCPCCKQKLMIKESSKKNGYVLFCKTSKIKPKPKECGFTFITYDDFKKYKIEVLPLDSNYQKMEPKYE